jgi:hypothetical protein
MRLVIKVLRARVGLEEVVKVVHIDQQGVRAAPPAGATDDRPDEARGDWQAEIQSAAVAAVSVLVSVSITGALAQPTVEVPQFKYDPSWPKPFPEGWVLGSVGSVCVDARDHVFAVTRGQPAPKERNLAVAAPPVIEFDADGNVSLAVQRVWH